MGRPWYKNRLVLVAILLVLLTSGLVAFVVLSELPAERPLLGVVAYSLIPLFFAAGAIIFYLALHQQE